MELKRTCLIRQLKSVFSSSASSRISSGHMQQLCCGWTSLVVVVMVMESRVDLCFGVPLSLAVVVDVVDAVVIVLANNGCIRSPNSTKYMINLKETTQQQIRDA